MSYLASPTGYLVSRATLATKQSIDLSIYTDRQQIIDLFPLDETLAVPSLGDTDEVYETWRGYHSRAEPNLPLDDTEKLATGRSRSRSVDGTHRKPRGKALEPGQRYKVYDWKQVASSTSMSSSTSDGLPRDLALVVDVVAEITGMGRTDVLKELYALEMLLQLANRRIRSKAQQEKKRRKCAGGKSSAATSAVSTTDGGSVA